MSEEAIEQVAQPEAAPLETPAEVAQGGSGDDFLSMIPEEIREHPSLSPIKDVSNLARSYVNAQRLIGADKLPLPANPSDADPGTIRADFATKLEENVVHGSDSEESAERELGLFFNN